MSIIQAKGTRGTDKPEAPSRDLYENKATNRVSQIPFYVGASLGALILYLKNSLVSVADAHGADEVDQPGAAKQHVPHDIKTNPVELHDVDLKKISLLGTDDATAESYTPLLSAKGLHSPTYQSQLYVNLGSMKFDSLDASYVSHSANLLGHGFSGAFPALSGNDNRLGVDPSVGGSARNSIAPSTGSVVGATDTGTLNGKPAHLKTPATPSKKNLAPVVTGSITLPDAFTCNSVVIFVADLLKNAIDPDGDKLSVTNVKINGTSLTLTGDHYTYHGNDVGFVTVTYKVTDGKLSTADTATIDLLPRPAILGGEGNDTLVGTNCGDNIYGGSGDDAIFGQTGNDVIYGGDGNDTLYGGGGNDTIFGGNGDDTIFGGNGNNFLFGGAGNDLIYAGDGNNTVFGGSGRDWIYAGAGSNKIFGGSGNDTVFSSGKGANNFFDGGTGVNKLSYTAYTGSLDINLNTGIVTTTSGLILGTDRFTNFQVFQGGANDTLFHAKIYVSTNQVTTSVDLKTAADPSLHAADHTTTLPDAAPNQGHTYLGGAGIDTLDYSPAKQALTIDVVHGMTAGAEIGTDYFSSIERFITGAGDDTFLSAGQGTAHHMIATDEPVNPDISAGPVVLSVARGNDNLLVLDDSSGDKVTGAAADQFFDGGAGFNTLDYSQATYGLNIDTAAGTATGADIGHDTFAHIQHFVGGSGSDHFTIGSGIFLIDGHGGGDKFTFLTPAAGEATHVQIRGLEVGDHIQMSKYDIFEQPSKVDGDQFSTIYASKDHPADPTLQDSVAPIRIRHETILEVQKTFVDGNIDGQNVYQTVIEIEGVHHFVVNNQMV